MEVLQTPCEMRRMMASLRSGASSIGLVPTMGALHEGHLSLLRASVQRCDQTVASLFVNPAQFGPSEDLERYPRTLERDLQLFEDEGVAAVYVPDTETVYPEGFSTYVEPPEVAKTLEGVCRPGHFRGVVTVVLKLFHAAPPTDVFFGRKDYQQLKVIEAMTRDLDLGIEIVGCETVRETDGLAMSSRNRYLSQQQRASALLLSRALSEVDHTVAEGQRRTETLETGMRRTLLGSAHTHTEGVDKIDYAVVVDAETLSPITEVDRPAVALIAAWVGKTRLIDNRLIGCRS